MNAEIRDISLAPSGARKIEWVKRNCPLLRGLEKEFSQTKPFAGKRVALSIHLEAKTAYLCKVIAAGGAELFMRVDLPDGTRQNMSAAEWWEHRREWGLSDFDHQDNRGGLVVCLVFAAMFDESIDQAKADGDAAEVDRLTKERDEMLNLYFGDGEQ